MQISDDVKGSNGKSYQAWIVPGHFNTNSFNNDPPYWRGDSSLPMVRKTKGRKAKVQFFQISVLES